MEDRELPEERIHAQNIADQRWDELFRRSPELLEKLANEAMAEYEAGLTEPIDLDDL